MNTTLPSKNVLEGEFQGARSRFQPRGSRPAGVPWKKEPDDVNLSFTASYLSTACRVGGKVGVHASRKYETKETGYVSRRNIVGFSVRRKHTVYIESAFYLLSPRHLIPLPFSVHSFVPTDSADDVSSGASSVAAEEIKIRPIARSGERGHFIQMKQFPDVVVLRRLSRRHDRCPSNFVVFVKILATL